MITAFFGVFSQLLMGCVLYTSTEQKSTVLEVDQKKKDLPTIEEEKNEVKFENEDSAKKIAGNPEKNNISQDISREDAYISLPEIKQEQPKIIEKKNADLPKTDLKPEQAQKKKRTNLSVINAEEQSNMKAAMIHVIGNISIFSQTNDDGR